MQWGTLFLDGLCLIGSGHSKGTLSAVLYYGPLVGLWRTVRGLLSGCNVRALLSGLCQVVLLVGAQRSTGDCACCSVPSSTARSTSSR